jgi:uncharacterized protein YbaP (TraB family)
MWKITGNGLTQPSYLYGTMHISGKMVFHLGDQFYDAIEGVDVVALELEPDAWLSSMFADSEYLGYMRESALDPGGLDYLDYGRESAGMYVKQWSKGPSVLLRSPSSSTDKR